MNFSPLSGRYGNLPCLICLLASLALLLTACSTPQETLPYIQLSQADSGSVAEAGDIPRLPLRVAVAAVISPKATIETYASLRDYLAEKLGRPVELVQRSTYAEVNDLVEAGAVDMAFVCGGALVEGERDFDMQILAAPQVNGETEYYSYLIVPADSPAQSMADLRGGSFAFTDPLSNSGYLAPSWRLRQMGEPPDTFFASTIFTNSHDNSIQAVADHLVDGAAVDSLVYEFLEAGGSPLIESLRVIERLGPYGIPPVVVHPDIDPDLRAGLLTVLLGMSADAAGRAALARLRIDRFVEIDPAAYQSLRAIAAEMRGWDELP